MRTTLLILILATTVGCSTLRFPGVYRIDIPQGNFVTEEMLGQLSPGMSPEQVRYVLGMPTLIDPFTSDTWFYLMTLQPGKGEKLEQQIVVHFNDGSYSHHEGEVIADFLTKVTAPDDRELATRADQQRRSSE
ncbi:MAG: outer membrane protein assembly factor BamE [Gammaproteobacteria bacterium HGW-Gammaproteobacteria-14]|nr:MAG: outer membrane protein assembly factor BamE [Gammaproteobacteria bacterium HGW-Gammaproteobacteria-14]